MKNLILIIGMFMSTSVMAQLEIKKEKDSILYERTGLMSQQVMTVQVFENDHHSIFFKNCEYTHITDIGVLSIGTNKNLKQLMELCIEACKTNEEFETDLYHIKKATKKAARIWTTDGWFYIQTRECQTILNSLSNL